MSKYNCVCCDYKDESKNLLPISVKFDGASSITLKICSACHDYISELVGVEPFENMERVELSVDFMVLHQAREYRQKCFHNCAKCRRRLPRYCPYNIHTTSDDLYFQICNRCYPNLEGVLHTGSIHEVCGSYE